MVNKSSSGHWVAPKCCTLFYSVCVYYMIYGCLYHRLHNAPILSVTAAIFKLSLYIDHQQKDTAGEIASNESNHNVSKWRCSFVTLTFRFDLLKLWTLVLFLWQFCLMCRRWWQLNANDDEWLSDCISSLHYLAVMASLGNTFCAGGESFTSLDKR